MKKLAALALSAFLVAGVNGSVAQAHTLPAKKYKNCTALRKAFPGGVAKSRTVQNSGGETTLTPKVSASIYKQNKGLDRDKDGIACEK